MQPPIVVLENLYECKDLEQLLVAAGALSRRPYIIAALASGTTQGIPLHQLLSHHQIRCVVRVCGIKRCGLYLISSSSLHHQGDHMQPPEWSCSGDIDTVPKEADIPTQSYFSVSKSDWSLYIVWPRSGGSNWSLYIYRVTPYLGWWRAWQRDSWTGFLTCWIISISSSTSSTLTWLTLAPGSSCPAPSTRQLVSWRAGSSASGITSSSLTLWGPSWQG